MVGFIIVEVVVENERDVLVLLVGAEDVGNILSNILCVVGGTRAATHQKFHRSLDKMNIKN